MKKIIVLAALILLCCSCATEFTFAQPSTSDATTYNTKGIEYPTPFHKTVMLSEFHSVLEQVPDENIAEHNENWRSEYMPLLQTLPWTGDSETESLEQPLGSGGLGAAFPSFVGFLKPGSGQTVNWTATCFQENSASIEVSESGARITWIASKPRNSYCYDLYLWADMENFYVKWIFKQGEHTIDIKQWKPHELNDIQENGLSMFLFPSGLLGELIDLWDMARFFIPYGGISYANNIEFLKKDVGFDFAKRDGGLIALNATEIKSGDCFVVTNYDGHDILIMFGTGSRASHVAMALWIDGELYILESIQQGVIKTPWHAWVAINVNSRTQVSILRLDPNYQRLFNEQKAIEFFKTVEGLPYGFNNFIFGWLDTEAGNYPHPLSPRLMGVAFGLVDVFWPKMATMAFVEGLNLRLGTKNMTLQQIFQEVRHVEELSKLLQIPERDEWVYHTIGDKPSLVCSAFVVRLYKEAGVFGDMTPNIQAAEFTPKDVYQLQIFDDKWEMPTLCAQQKPQQNGMNYCQISGEYIHYLPFFNSVKPYPHMNEKCESMPPVYTRGPAQC